MPDLRTLSSEDRRRLAEEAKRRAHAGEAPADIRLALGLSRGTYSAWATRYGFRACDLCAESVGEDETPPPQDNAITVLAAVRSALAEGNRSQADKLIADWKRQTRHIRDLRALEIAAAEDLAALEDQTLDDQTLAELVSGLIGRSVQPVRDKPPA